MDKARRHQLKMLKFKKRLKQLGLLGVDGNFNSFRSHGKPCSCFLCKNEKYKRGMDNIKVVGEELEYQISK